MGGTTILAKITSIQSDLCDEKGQITHAEVPTELVVEPRKRPREGDSDPRDDGLQRLKENGSGSGNNGPGTV